MASAAQDMQNDYDPWDAACVDLTDISARPPRELAMLASKLLFRVLASHFSHLRRKKHHFSTAACFQFVLTRLDLT